MLKKEKYADIAQYFKLKSSHVDLTLEDNNYIDEHLNIVMRMLAMKIKRKEVAKIVNDVLKCNTTQKIRLTGNFVAILTEVNL